MCLARLAVPFFFTTAGFLLFRKVDFSNYTPDVSIRYLKKTAFLYGIWRVLQFRGSHLQMWFLTALMGGTIGSSIICSRKIPRWSKVLTACVLYCIGLLGTFYFWVLQALIPNKTVIAFLEDLLLSSRNGLFMGTPVMMLGAFLADKRLVIPKKNSKNRSCCFHIAAVCGNPV